MCIKSLQVIIFVRYLLQVSLMTREYTRLKYTRKITQL